ncbi:MAG: ABC transporter ATP-binding protein [Planctomycetes bacterium]|nr:ABC transporter ATP-binding protein [Planctomycetota bacterium]
MHAASTGTSTTPETPQAADSRPPEDVSAPTTTATSTTAAVHAVNMTKTIDERLILDRINFTIRPGQYVTLLGANGAGKSTMLRILASLSQPSRGKLTVFGHELTRASSPSLRARIGMIGHQPMLYRELAAVENLTFFGRLYGLPDARTRAMELLEYVGLADRAGDPVKAFSRGMTQRVAIARALMHEPDLLLADEPFAGLDAPSTRMVELMLARLHDEGRTIILTNHDITQSLRLAEHALVLHGRRIALDEPTADLDPEEVLKKVGWTSC